MTPLILFIVFLVFSIIGLPVAVSLGISSVIYIIIFKITTIDMIATIFFASIEKFTLLSIPFFILAGLIMEKSGITRRLIDFISVLTGSIKGSLAYVTILTSMFFSAISGSGPATVAAVGSIVLPTMIKKGYDKGYSSALAASSGSMGIIIPPSIAMIIYGVIASVSIGKIFIAGIIPGIIFGVSLMIASYFVFTKSKNVIEEKNIDKNIIKISKTKLIFNKFIDAFWGILSPVIILGGIYSGIFTPTEAAGVSVVYSIIIGMFIYKELNFKQLIDVFYDTIIMTSTIIFIIAMASLFAWIITVEGFVEIITTQVISWQLSPIVLMLIINVILLIAGCFLDAISIYYIFTPIILPVIDSIGFDRIAFGVIMTVNLAIGQITPPVGVNLFVASKIANISLDEISKKLLPFFIAICVALFILILFPKIITFLPDLLKIK